MKSISVFPMASYKSKIYGLIITIVSLVLLLVVSIHGALPYPAQANASEQFNLLLALATFGLYMIAWSKEKQEDERVQRVRAKAMHVGFAIFIISTLMPSMATIIVSVKKHEVLTFDGSDLTCVAALGLVAYLIVFYVGLLFDPAWIYNDDTVIPNIRKNKQFFIIYALSAIILFVAIFLLHKK